jgi:hypothetical protein
MRELTRLTTFVLTLCCTATSVIAQRHPSPPPKKEVIEIEATTRDGKVVILKSDGTWRYATPAERASEPPTVTKKTTLSLETGIIYRNGEVVPVARTTFYLLDDDVLTIAKSGGIQPRPDTLSIYKDVDRSLLSDIAHALAGQYQSLYADFGANFLKVLDPHIIARFTTDFSGKATVADLEAKQYYLFGAGATRRSSALWNMRIDLAKETHISLDQNNAATAY